VETLFKLVCLISLNAAIVGIVILLFKTLLGNRISPRWHYIIWGVLIIKLLVPFGPASKISLFNALPANTSISLSQTYEDVQQARSTPAEAIAGQPAANQGNASSGFLTKVSGVLPYLWLIGVLLMTAWLLYTHVLLNIRIRRRGRPVPDSFEALLAHCQARAGVKRSVRVLVQDVIATPAIIGPFRPRILLTDSFLNLSSKDTSYILMHELAHYRRGDLLANHLLLILQTIHWFNPVIWYCFHRIRQDMELAADQRVLHLLDGDEPREYGRALLAAVERCSSSQLAPRLIGMVDDKKNIEKRIVAIKMTTWFENKKRLIMVTGLICVIVLGGLFLTNGVAKDQAPKPSPSALTTALSQEQVNHIKERVKGFDSANKTRGFISGYISTFLRQGYSKYYDINLIEFRFNSLAINNGKLEAEVMTTMKYRPKDLASDPDTVPYIKEAKEKAQKENDPAVKKMLQGQYETLKSEYGKVEGSNFTFKFTANVVDNDIDDNSIKLYSVQDAAPNHTEYIPAEDILPKQ